MSRQRKLLSECHLHYQYSSKNYQLILPSNYKFEVQDILRIGFMFSGMQNSFSGGTYGMVAWCCRPCVLLIQFVAVCFVMVEKICWERFKIQQAISSFFFWNSVYLLILHAIKYISCLLKSALNSWFVSLLNRDYVLQTNLESLCAFPFSLFEGFPYQSIFKLSHLLTMLCLPSKHRLNSVNILDDDR